MRIEKDWRLDRFEFFYFRQGSGHQHPDASELHVGALLAADPRGVTGRGTGQRTLNMRGRWKRKGPQEEEGKRTERKGRGPMGTKMKIPHKQFEMILENKCDFANIRTDE